MVQAIEFGHAQVRQIAGMVEALVAQVKPVKEAFTSPAKPAILASPVSACSNTGRRR